MSEYNVKVYESGRVVSEINSPAAIVVGVSGSGIVVNATIVELITLLARVQNCTRQLEEKILDVGKKINLTKERLQDLLSLIDICTYSVDATDGEQAINDLIARLSKGGKHRG